MLTNLSARTIKVLGELVERWDAIKAALRLSRPIRGSGAARVTSTDAGVVIHVDHPEHKPDDPPPLIPYLAVVTAAGPSDGVYVCDVFRLAAGRATSTLTVGNVKGTAIATGAYLLDIGGSTTELASGTVALSWAFHIGTFDGKPTFAALGIPKGGC